MNYDPIIKELHLLKKYIETVNGNFISTYLTGKCDKGWVSDRDPDKDYYLWSYYPVMEMQSNSIPSISVKDE